MGSQLSTSAWCKRGILPCEGRGPGANPGAETSFPFPRSIKVMQRSFKPPKQERYLPGEPVFDFGHGVISQHSSL